MSDSILLTIPLPVAVYAALVGMASADADTRIERLAAFAVRDFVEAYTGCRLGDDPTTNARCCKGRLKAV